MSVIILAFLIGLIAGLRAMTAPAAVSCAAALGWVPLDGTWAAFLGYAYTPWIFTVLALGEFVTDQLPQTPSRKVPMQFGARIVSGAFCGAALGASAGSTLPGLVLGGLGAVVGTLGGADVRGRMARAFGNARPAALIEDVVAVVGAFLIIAAV